MNFKGHACGGTITSIGSAGAYIALNSNTISLSTHPQPVLFVAGIALFFSLYPDFDTASIPQRWFFRCLFIALCVLFFFKQYLYISILSIISIIPLLHKHRGLTHLYSFSIIFPIAICFVVEYYVFGNVLPFKEILIKYGYYIGAAILGWWTHLFLDRITPW